MTEPARRTSRAGDVQRERFLDLLEASADESGFVPFDRFMDLALYGEGVGYYTREGSPFGPEGDYYTAAHASPLFGRSIAERVKSVALSLPKPSPVRVLEIGPGDGTLGETVVSSLAQEPRLQSRLEYVLVDRSPALRAHAFERVSAAGEANGIPVTAAEGVGADGPFSGVVLANEVLDAQPARRLRWDGHGWEELGVRREGTTIRPASATAQRPVPDPPLPHPASSGVIVEISPMAEGIVREVADHLVSGLFVVLDYGLEESELLAAHPSGTLAAVRRHRVVDDPLEDPGGSDLSTFVNFTRVRSVAVRAGFREVAYRRQAEALGAWGFPRLLEEALRSAPSAQEEVRTRLGAKNLLFGFERFYSLELAPPSGAEAPETLT